MSNVEVLSHPKAVSMADEWFQFATADHFWMQWRHCMVARAVKQSGVSVQRALEVGCGHGVARELLERDFDFAVDGCDLNQKALEMARPGRGRLLVYDVLEQSLPEQYDAVFLLDVIEHVPDDVAFVQAASRHLRPGGLIILNVPAHRRLASDYDRIAGHLRRYSRRQMANLLRLCEIQPGAIWQWGLSMVPLLVARKALLASKRSDRSETVLRNGFVPPTKTANLLLHALKNLETILPFPMPLGSSILAWGTVSRFSPRN